MGHDGHKVLVVDDNQDIRDLVLHILSADGFHTFAASNAIEAMGILNSNAIELVLLDVMMPGKSGLELLSDIRTGPNRKIHDVPVVMITAKSSIEDVDQALALGANSYIVKPFRGVLIREKVRSFFETKVGE
jgi:two-component system OmpR family response regulator